MVTLVKTGYPVKCVLCSKNFVVEAFACDMQRWQDGELIQEALPYLAPEWRELLISGICPDCWDFVWGGADESLEDFEE